MPLFGLFFVEILFNLMNIQNDLDNVYEENNFWCLILTILAAGTIFTSFTQKYGFGYTAQNMIKVVRADLYESIIKKQVAWFDKTENTPGQLTNVLAAEV